VRLGELLAYPPRDRMPAMLFGFTGMGKTRIVQRFVREHGSRYRSAARHHPVAGGGLQMPTPHERDF
jgi:Bacterial TniB protein